MDFAGGFGRLGALVDGPGTRFLGADGEECLQLKQLVSRANDPRKAGFFQSEIGEIFDAFFRFHADQFRFDRG